MTWTNGPLVLYHGTDLVSAANILSTTGVQCSLGKALTDFGRGFYTTTNLHQARNWANQRCRVLARRPGPHPVAVVVELRIDRSQLARLLYLTFVTEDTGGDFWNLVGDCRSTPPPAQTHHPPTPQSYYDVVYGPVSLWPQTLVIKDCDQVSFHTAAAEKLLMASTRVAQAPGSPLL